MITVSQQIPIHAALAFLARALHVLLFIPVILEGGNLGRDTGVNSDTHTEREWPSRWLSFFSRFLLLAISFGFRDSKRREVRVFSTGTVSPTFLFIMFFFPSSFPASAKGRTTYSQKSPMRWPVAVCLSEQESVNGPFPRPTGEKRRKGGGATFENDRCCYGA